MLSEVVKAFIVGICAAIPVGPVLLLVIQKTLCRGRNAGLMTGFGSGIADTLFAAVGLFTLSYIENFVALHSSMIMLIGGGVIALIGINVLIRKVSLANIGDMGAQSLVNCSLQSCGSALSNPGALAVMITLLASFGLFGEKLESPLWLILSCVFAGEMIYWLLVVFILTKYIRLKERTLQILSKIAGIAVIVFAVVLIIRGIVSL